MKMVIISPKSFLGGLSMTTEKTMSPYFHEYFAEWIEVYKQGAVRPVTFQKYLLSLRRLTELASELRFCELDKRRYQVLLNDYAKTHERETTMNFHHHLKSVILDAIDEGLLTSDPTRKVIIKGKTASNKKPKFLSQFELQMLLKNLNLKNKPNWDWFILLMAKTGLRFAEALALTPNDFDFTQQKVKITKTWNYRKINGIYGGFGETKNYSSKRTLQIDPQLSEQFLNLTKGLPEDKPIFITSRVFNSTVNGRLKALCKKAEVPIIALHALRHTHASMLIFAGVSIASIAKRLGHSSMVTTQETYLHIIRELENQDNDKIMLHLSLLT